MLFESIANSKYFEKSALILFLNKIDLFREKVMSGKSREGVKADTRAAVRTLEVTLNDPVPATFNEVLAMVARRVQAAVLTTDTVGRIGGVLKGLPLFWNVQRA